jgi:hypothetical protein
MADLKTVQQEETGKPQVYVEAIAAIQMGGKKYPLFFVPGIFSSAVYIQWSFFG